MAEIDLGVASLTCRLRPETVDANFARLHSGLSFWSLGERIEISLQDFDGGLLIDICSGCIMFQIEDWGKNRRNG